MTRLDHLHAAEELLERVKDNLDMLNGSPGLVANTKDVLHFDTLLRAGEMHVEIFKAMRG